MKQFLKKAAIWCNHGLLVLCLFILPSTFLFTFIFSHSENTKSLLVQSKVYDTLSRTIASASAGSLQNSGVTYGLSEDVVRHASEVAFSPSKMKKTSEALIDNAYEWLNGEKPTLKLELNLNSNQKEFLQVLSDSLVKTTSEKPVCTNEQIQQLAQNQSTILQAPCRPSDMDLSTIKEQFSQDNPNIQLTTQKVSDLTSNDSQIAQQPGMTTAPEIGNTLYGVSIPVVFGVLSGSFYIVLFLLIIAFIILVVLIRDSQKYISNIAKPLLTTGVLLVVYGLLSWWIVSQNLLSKFIPGEQGKLTEKTMHTFALISIKTVLIFGGTYILCSAILFIFHHRGRKQQLAELPKAETPPTPPKDTDRLEPLA